MIVVFATTGPTDAAELGRRLEEHARRGALEQTAERWSDLLLDVTVSSEGSIVVLSADLADAAPSDVWRSALGARDPLLTGLVGA